MEAYVNVEGCILCFDGVGNVQPGVTDNLTEQNKMGVLLANVELDPLFDGKTFTVENIFYDLGKATLRKEGKKSLESLALVIKDNPQIKVELGAHTDSRGTAESNLDLSKRRAQSAVDYLVNNLDVSSSHIISAGFGEQYLKNRCADGVLDCTEKEHQENRRTEIRVLNIDKSKKNLKSLKEIRVEEEFLKSIFDGESETKTQSQIEDQVTLGGQERSAEETAQIQKEIKEQEERKAKEALEMKKQKEMEMKMEQEKLAMEKKEMEMKMEQEKLAKEKKEKEMKMEQEKLAKEKKEMEMKMEQEKLAKEKKEMEMKMEQEKLAKEKKQMEMKMEQEKLAKEKKEMEMKMEQEKLAKEKKEMEAQKEINVIEEGSKKIEKKPVYGEATGNRVFGNTSSQQARYNEIRKSRDPMYNYNGYKIVIHFSQDLISEDHDIFQRHDDLVNFKSRTGTNLYLIGDYQSKEDAEEFLLNRVKKMYPGAYIVGFRNGNRLN